MEFERQKIPEVILIKPKVNKDERGFFVETFRKDKLEKFIGYSVHFVRTIYPGHHKVS